MKCERSLRSRCLWVRATTSISQTEWGEFEGVCVISVTVLLGVDSLTLREKEGDGGLMCVRVCVFIWEEV
jgi:hypothetical protein